MNQSPDNQADGIGLPAGLLAALSCAVLLLGAFALTTASTPMPPAERWAALTAFALLTLAYTLQGSAALYDALGRTVRRDTRALATLLALLPALYVSYSLAVGEFTWPGLLTAATIAALPAVALVRSQGSRAPTILDLVAVLYFWLSIELGLVPALGLPQQGSLIGFFHLSAVPLLLLLLAARGWPGLGFTWFLSRADLRLTVMAATVAVVVVMPLALAIGYVPLSAVTPSALELFGRAIFIYFFVAVPEEILFRGVIQNGIARALTRWRAPGAANGSRRVVAGLGSPAITSLLITALLYGAAHLNDPPMAGRYALLAAVAGLIYGLVYQRTGKVTAAAAVHMLVDWSWSIFFVQ